MADISIALSDVQNVKTLEVKGMGDFVVRKLGPGEELNLSVKRRRLVQISSEMTALKDEMDKLTDDEERDKFATKHLKHIDKLSEEITQIQKYELDTYKRCFTGEKSDELIDALTPEERMKIYAMLFAKDDDENSQSA